MAVRGTDRASSQAVVRRTNVRDALQLVIDGDGVASRASIARATALTSATVSSIVAELVDAGLVEHAGLADSTGGKPATTLRVRRDLMGFAALVLRAGRIRSAILDLTGDVVLERPTVDGPVTVDAIVREVNGLIASTSRRLLGICIDTTGTVEGGVIHESVHLGLREVDVAAALAPYTDLPVLLINDADADALREFSLHPTDEANLLSISVGQGIGMAVVIDRHLHRGPRSLAGEVGHLRMDYSDDAPLCWCGNRGCLERFAAVPVMLGLDGIVDTSALELPEGWVASDEVRQRADRAQQLLARMLLNVCAALDISEVVVCGSAPQLGPWFLDGLTEYCRRWHPIGTAQISLRYAEGAVEEPFRGAAEHGLRETLGVTWSGAR